MNKILLILTASLFISCNSPENIAIKAAVVSARTEASKIGVNIMDKGGNAFDAMIATDLALSVCYPNAGNIAGGGFLVYRKNDGSFGSLDYREKAPSLASRDMYLNSDGNVIKGKSIIGGLAIGVPGTVAGLYEVHKKFGSLPWSELVQPAIDLATRGYLVTEKQQKSFDGKKNEFIEVNGENTFYAKKHEKGDIVINLPLANTLKLIQENGRAGFYQGVNAERFINRVKNTGGIISKEDLKNYYPVWRKPIQFEYKELTITSMAPPSSGGVCLGQMLKMIEPFDIKKYGHNSMESIQVMVEAERRSYADRTEYLGDPDFVNIPQNELLDSLYLNKRMSDFNWKKATLSSDINPGNIVFNETEETTHYSIIDKEGNAVSVTTTLNGSYGSKVYVEDGGYFLNNEMDDFSSKPGVPNMFGLLGSEANSILPGKRMLSSMTPTIVEKNKKLYMILGTPGGSTIITSVFQTILNAYEFNMGIQESVNAARFHHQWMPDIVILEPKQFDLSLILNLNNIGYNIEERFSRIIGRVDAIMIDDNGVISTGADPRGDDSSSVLR
ncbi:MAG: gamma-glutamyltranspeptidase/glutathione hydrolase [Candidatus Marivariicella framensis]|jgi:gamma-glutamyltranspeptidase/glutathione hydrolase|tara:strand:+ start:1844 stop:3514 length:1671 start_codon:yes stop_codon:yes gene_type:complete